MRSKTFIAQPEAQKFIHREWLGPLLYQALHPASESSDSGAYQLRCVLYATMAWIASVLFLPLVAIVPFVENAVYEWLMQRHTTPLA
jgi:hypothetical protein